MVESSKRSADFEISDIIWSMVENVIKTDDELLADIPLEIQRGPLLSIEDSIKLLGIPL